MLECKYSVKKLRDEAVNGDRDILGMTVVRTSMKGKQEGIGLAGPHTNEEGGGEGGGGGVFPESKDLNFCSKRHDRVAHSDSLSITERYPNIALCLRNCTLVSQALLGTVATTARPGDGSLGVVAPRAPARCHPENLPDAPPHVPHRG